MTYYNWLLGLIQASGFDKVSSYTLSVFDQVMDNSNILAMMIGG